MRQWWKAFVVVAVTLPIAAYVVATLSAAPAQPTPQSPVVLRDPPPSPAPGAPEPGRAGQQGSDDDRDDGTPDGKDDGNGGGADRDVSVVTPSPKRVGDDEGPEHEGDDGGGSDDRDQSRDTSEGGDT